MFNPFIDLITSIIEIYNFALFVWIILGLLISFEVVNRFNPVVSKVNQVLTSLIEPALKYIRKYVDKFLPNIQFIDISPIILILLLKFFVSSLQHYFYDYGM